MFWADILHLQSVNALNSVFLIHLISGQVVYKFLSHKKKPKNNKIGLGRGGGGSGRVVSVKAAPSNCVYSMIPSKENYQYNLYYNTGT